MSSREIAKLTGKVHRNVVRDATNMLTELYDVRDTLKFEHIYLDTMNSRQTELLLPKRETLILVSGYSVELRAHIVDRWMELEKQQGESKMGRTITNSRAVAETFGRLNKNVLQGIQNLECSPEFARLNFQPCETPHPTIKGRMITSFDITKDGFTFLVMGYTGKVAAQFKEAYIARFNEMEETLHSSHRDARDEIISFSLSSPINGLSPMHLHRDKI